MGIQGHFQRGDFDIGGEDGGNVQLVMARLGPAGGVGDRRAIPAETPLCDQRLQAGPRKLRPQRRQRLVQPLARLGGRRPPTVFPIDGAELRRKWKKCRHLIGINCRKGHCLKVVPRKPFEESSKFFQLIQILLENNVDDFLGLDRMKLARITE